MPSPVEHPAPTTNVGATPIGRASSGHPSPLAAGWAELRIWAETYNDAQEHRIAAANRFALKGPKATERSNAASSVSTVVFGEYVQLLVNTEHEAKGVLRRCYKRVVPPELVAWQRSTTGIGEHLFARLLGHLGDPYMATPHRWVGSGSERELQVAPQRERTVSELWSYCGHGDPTRRRSRGSTVDEAMATGSPTCKNLLFLLSSKAILEPGRSITALLAGDQQANGVRWCYRQVYEQRRLATRDRAHAEECVRCGPSGRPAEPGSAWSDGHRHADALRIVGKEILRAMWLVRNVAVPILEDAVS